MSRRWSILGLTNSLTVVAVGQMLNWFDFPFNYQVIFLGSAIGGFISIVFSSSLKLPPQEVRLAATGPGKDIGGSMGLAETKQAVLNFTIAQFVFRLGLTMACAAAPVLGGAESVATAHNRVINSTQTLS